MCVGVKVCGVCGGVCVVFLIVLAIVSEICYIDFLLATLLLSLNYFLLLPRAPLLESAKHVSLHLSRSLSQ